MNLTGRLRTELTLPLCLLLLFSRKALPGPLIRGDVYFWDEVMAGAILGSVPMIILSVFFFDEDVSGLTAGAIK